MAIHYLTDEEEQAIKQSIPWDSIDAKIRGSVRLANEVEGIATLQSCAGHVHPLEDGGFSVDAALIAFRATKERTLQILFDAAPRAGILDASLRFFGDGTFWICVECEPPERWRLYDLFKELLECST